MPRRIKKHLVNTRRRKHHGGGKKKGGKTLKKVGGSGNTRQRKHYGGSKKRRTTKRKVGGRSCSSLVNNKQGGTSAFDVSRGGPPVVKSVPAVVEGVPVEDYGGPVLKEGEAVVVEGVPVEEDVVDNYDILIENLINSNKDNQIKHIYKKYLAPIKDSPWNSPIGYKWNNTQLFWDFIKQEIINYGEISKKNKSLRNFVEECLYMWNWKKKIARTP